MEQRGATGAGLEHTPQPRARVHPGTLVVAQHDRPQPLAEHARLRVQDPDHGCRLGTR